MQFAISLFVFVSTVVCLIFVAGAFYVYLVAFRADHRQIDESILAPADANVKIGKDRIHYLISDILDTPHEVVAIKSFDGLNLSAKYYHHADGAPLDILFHGYRSASCRDCCGVFRISKDQGHNVLLVDQRAHGKSEGIHMTMGLWERFDIADWAACLAERCPQCKLVLHGCSMGAATVLYASAQRLPQSVCCCVEDCGYTSPGEAFLQELHYKYSSLPLKRAVLGVTNLICRAVICFDLWWDDVRAAVRVSTLPTLFLHGTADRAVPHRMGQELFALHRGPKQLELFEGAQHAVSYFADEQRYRSCCRQFILACGAADTAHSA